MVLPDPDEDEQQAYLQVFYDYNKIVETLIALNIRPRPFSAFAVLEKRQLLRSQPYILGASIPMCHIPRPI